MGVIGNFIERRRADSETKLAIAELGLGEAKLAKQQIEYTTKTLGVLEANRQAELDDDTGWFLHTGETADRGELTEKGVQNVQKNSYKMYKTNPHGRAVIRGLEKFIIGKGVYVDHHDDSDEVSDYWKRFERENNWTIRQKEIVKRGLRDGEDFVLMRRKRGKGESTIVLRFIDPLLIRAKEDGTPSYGVYTDAKDVETVTAYNFWDGENHKRINGKNVIHVKLNADMTDKRGIPVLEPVMSYIKKYEQWLNDRIILNKVRTAIALVKKYDATPEQVAIRRGTQQSDRYAEKGFNYKQKMLEPGTVIHTNQGVEYEFLTPKLDARDVAADGRSILLAIAAGAGLPEYIVTGDASNANYSSTLVAESPAVREIEDYQSTFGFYFNLIYREVMKLGIEVGDIKTQDEEKTMTASFIFPSIIARDIYKENQAWEIQREHKVLSIKTWREQADYNHENEEVNLAAEGEQHQPLPSAGSRRRNNTNDGE